MVRPRPKNRWQRPSLPVIKVAWLRLALLVIAALVVLIGGGRLTSLHHLQIKGTHTLTQARVTQLVNANLRKQWFGHNVLLVNTGSLASYLEQSDLSIKQATIQRKLPHTLVVTIQERQPALNWKTEGIVYLLDSNATVIGPTIGSYAKLPTVTDSSNLPVKVGNRVAPTQFVSFCVSLVALLPSTGYAIQQMTVPVSTSEVYVTTTSGLTLKFDTTRSAAGEVTDLKAVQAELQAAGKTPTQYIDLRIPNKAYYQ
ncbi:MAG TPA: FtsQ-type POTRA domain-containing protein [Candidatus Saccharimonadales bacterium]|nr:FtsQ-type POTRA domain-containing protein [Candidatus Saccharimonadales bacterium]